MLRYTLRNLRRLCCWENLQDELHKFPEKLLLEKGIKDSKETAVDISSKEQLFIKISLNFMETAWRSRF